MATDKPSVGFGPCCFCGKDIAKHGPDPCRVKVETAAGKPQFWFCHAACFRQRLCDTPDAPGLFEPAYF